MRKVIVLLAVLCFVGCKTKYVPVETVKTEYKHSTDTVRQTDSVLVTEWMTITEADSTELAAMGIRLKDLRKAYVIERNKVERLLREQKESHTDTVIKTDSIQVPYPVERELSKWEKVKMEAGGVGIGAIALIILYSAFCLVRKLRARRRF